MTVNTIIENLENKLNEDQIGSSPETPESLFQRHQKTAMEIASACASESTRLINVSKRFDFWTVLLAFTVPPYTTYVAVATDLGPAEPFLKGAMIVMVALAGALPLLKRINGASNLALHYASAARNIRTVVNKAIAFASTVESDMIPDKKAKHYTRLVTDIRTAISEAKDSESEAFLNIMKEASTLADEESRKLIDDSDTGYKPSA
jgi:hypothetical protein